MVSHIQVFISEIVYTTHKDFGDTPESGANPEFVKGWLPGSYAKQNSIRYKFTFTMMPMQGKTLKLAIISQELCRI